MSKSSMDFEEGLGRFKVIIRLRSSRWLITLFTLSLAVWLAMLVVVLSYLIRGRASSGILVLILLVWILIWLWFGRFLWNRWQYFVASREIVIIDGEQVIIRRPVSLLGLTTSYDLRHVSPLYYSEKHQCPAFDYAYHHVYFGQSLEIKEARELIAAINARFFDNDGDD